MYVFFKNRKVRLSATGQRAGRLHTRYNSREVGAYKYLPSVLVTFLYRSTLRRGTVRFGSNRKHIRMLRYGNGEPFFLMGFLS